MATSRVLQRLYSLDTPTDLLRNLYCLIQYDEKEQYLTSLRGSELAQLVDFLDESLSTIPTTDNVARECLNKLQAICGHHATLPSSYIVSGQIARVGDGPIDFGVIADVWEGTYRNKKVYIKHLRVRTENHQTLKLFFREAVMWKRLSHPNIVPFIGIATSPLQTISEWMPNGTLMEFVERNPGANRIGLLLDVAEGLDYLHANNIIHGNLNESSILVGHDCHARLTDLEFASIVRGVNSAAQKNRYAMAWAAPEILKGASTITREADVFSFGMVVIEPQVFTGGPPFNEFTAPVIASKIIDGGRPARPWETQELGLTDSIWAMTVRCWHQDPDQRPMMKKVLQLVRDYRTATWGTKITDIPAKLLICNVLPFCEGKDVLSLGCTNKFFALITNDDTFWRRKVAIDYNFSGLKTARTSGWKFMYRKLRNTRVFVWGDKDDGRLGLSEFPETTFSDVPFPVELHLPGVHVVSLTMGNRFLHVLGADGSVYACGVLNPWYEPPPRHKDFSGPCEIAWTPLKLQLPVSTRSISCGYNHATTLDANSTVWNFISWGRPFRLVSPFLDCSSPKTTPVQAECGLAFSAVLTRSGDVYAWWPFTGTFKNRYREDMAKLDKDKSTKTIVPRGRTVIPCHTWEINTDPVKVPILPDLPDLPGTGLSEEERKKETKLIKIAALDHCLVGLTNQGHVLVLDGMGKEDSIRNWHYLPNYSEIDKVKGHPAFCTTTGNDDKERPPEVDLSSDTMLITHISARFTSFFAYSSSMVLKGECYITPEKLPTIIPELQNRSVISIVIGNRHSGALTSSGKLLAWGEYVRGNLGLGDPGKVPAGSPGGYAEEKRRTRTQTNRPPPDVTVPTEVKFSHGLAAEGRGKKYCLSAAAGLYHTAALVADLAEDEVLPEDLK